MPFKCHNLYFINDQILYNNVIKIFLCDLIPILYLYSPTP